MNSGLSEKKRNILAGHFVPLCFRRKNILADRFVLFMSEMFYFMCSCFFCEIDGSAKMKFNCCRDSVIN